MKRILIGAVGVMLAAFILTGCDQGSGIEVTTAVAKTDGDVSALSWHGNIEADKSVDIFPNSTGRVVEITAAEGARVQAGAVLFKVDSADAQLSLKQAEASCKTAEVSFANAEAANSENTAVTPAQITYNDARDNYTRTKELYNGGVISQVELDGAKSKMDAAAAQLRSAKNGQQGTYDSSAAQLESARAALEIAKKRLNDCTVTSPIDGLVTKVNVVAGQTVSTQAAAITIMDDSRENINIQVADLDISQVNQGQVMNIYLQSLGQTCQGTVEEISPVCDPKTGMFQVKVKLNAGDQSYVGLSADVTIPADQAASTLYVPAKCITEENEKNYVYLVKDGLAVKTEVEAGKKKNAYMEVLGGLAAGDMVVMQSSKELTDGMNVKVISTK